MSDLQQNDHAMVKAEEMLPLTVRPMAWIEDNLYQADASSSQTHQLSPFERLPLELRQQIYSYLGFPIVARAWVESNHPWDGGSETPWGDNDPRSDSETRIKVIETELRPPAWAIQRYVMNNEYAYGHVGFENSLLSVCRMTRADTLSLLYHKIPVRLTSKLWQVPKKIENFAYHGYIRILHVEDSLFIPHHWHHTRNHAMRNRMLINQAEALCFFANHCFSLRVLRFHPYLPAVPICMSSYPNNILYQLPSVDRFNGYETHLLGTRVASKPKQSLMQSLALGLGLLARKCDLLETIEIPRAVCTHHIRPNGQVISKADLALEDPASSTWGFEPVDVHMYTLDLTHMPAFNREEETRFWAEEVLQELVKRGPAYKLDVRPFPSTSG